MTAPRSRTLALAWLALAAALPAGCAAPDGGPDAAAGASPISLGEALEAAEPTLDAWNEGAELVAASGFEGAGESPALQRRQAQGSSRFPLEADPLPGDGRAPGWVLVVIADGRTRTLRVTADNATWLDEGGREAGEGVRPVGELPMDSPRAAQLASEASPRFEELVAAGDVSVFWTLGNGTRGPRWQLRARSQALADSATLFVDARTGEVRNRTEAQTATQTRRFEGNLTRSAPADTRELELARNGTRVAVQLSWNRSVAENGTRLAANLTAGGTRLEPAQIQRGASRFQARWDGLDAGDYELEVAAEGLGNRSSVSYQAALHVG